MDWVYLKNEGAYAGAHIQETEKLDETGTHDDEDANQSEGKNNQNRLP